MIKNKEKLTTLFTLQDRRIKRLIVILNDIFLVTFSFIISGFVANKLFVFDRYYILFLGISGIFFFYRKIHDNVIKNIGLRYISNLIIGIVLSFFSYYLFIKFIIKDIIASEVIFNSGFIAFFLILLSRMVARFLLYENFSPKEKIILYTDYEDIDEAVNLASSAINFELVAIISSEERNKGRFIDGVEIFNINSFKKIVEKHNISKLFIASHHNLKELDSNLFDSITSFPIKVFKIPDLQDIISKKGSFDDLKYLSLEDFISRKVDDGIKLSDEENKIIKNKIVLVTGAGGSIGSILSKQIFVNKPKLLIILDNSEFGLFKIESELKTMNNNSKVVSKLVNIADKDLLKTIFTDFKIDTVYHAAAYKHVNILESEIKSAIKNNVIGTYYLVNECSKNNVKNFVMISTDKAANPSTVMGKTKKFCELIVENFNRKNNNGIYSSVRFGNVFNSSGSVIQIFKHQIKKGQDLTLTDANVTRFFMSIEEAVKLVIKASVIGKGGEVFVLDMGTPIKILDIAKRMIHLSGNTIKSESNPDGDIGITITGLKQGEKLHEILSENPVSKTEHPQILLSIENRNAHDIEKRIESIMKAVNENDQESMRKILN